MVKEIPAFAGMTGHVYENDISLRYFLVLFFALLDSLEILLVDIGRVESDDLWYIVGVILVYVCRDFFFVCFGELEEQYFLVFALHLTFSHIVGLDVIDALDTCYHAWFDQTSDKSFALATIIGVGDESEKHGKEDVKGCERIWKDLENLR
jgi:hypothetical protein